MDSFIGWVGGKKLLRKEIIKRFPEQMERYIEVCGGAAWVLFAKEQHAKFEVYNDANSDLVNLFKCIKYHLPELQRELAFTLNSREIFYELKNQYKIPGMTDIQRAARFFTLIRISYGSTAKSYCCTPKDITQITKRLQKIEQRLSKVVVENKDFEGLIKLYDKPKSLFYVDPPYYGTEKYYTAGFTTDDHKRLKNTLANINGKFLLSYNDCEFIRQLYKEYNIEEISRNHNLVGRYTQIDHQYKELIIKNY